MNYDSDCYRDSDTVPMAAGILEGDMEFVQSSEALGDYLWAQEGSGGTGSVTFRFVALAATTLQLHGVVRREIAGGSQSIRKSYSGVRSFTGRRDHK